MALFVLLSETSDQVNGHYGSKTSEEIFNALTLLLDQRAFDFRDNYSKNGDGKLKKLVVQSIDRVSANNADVDHRAPVSALKLGRYRRALSKRRYALDGTDHHMLHEPVAGVSVEKCAHLCSGSLGVAECRAFEFCSVEGTCRLSDERLDRNATANTAAYVPTTQCDIYASTLRFCCYADSISSICI